jgi:hypothetical protein
MIDLRRRVIKGDSADYRVSLGDVNSELRLGGKPAG